MTPYHYYLIDGDDDYTCESIDELNDIIQDIADHASPEEHVILTIEFIPLSETEE